MSAELLRKAATILRERAKAATPGPWAQTAGFKSHDDDRVYVVPVNDELHYVCAGGGLGADEDAPYIATMHPGVGLALADWLDEIALAWSIHDEHLDPDGFPITFDEALESRSVPIARLIVGAS